MNQFLKKKLFLIILLFLAWRINLFFISYLGPLLIDKWGNRFPYSEELLISTKLPYWLWSWGNFDGVHYLTIAKSFYSAYFTQTFFPLYPLLIRFVSKLIFFNNDFVSAFFISNTFFLCSLFLFSKLIRLNGYGKNLTWILLFYIFFPTSYYFGSIYTESLFILLIFASFYFAHKKRWLIASVCGILASATRLFGILMIFALLTEYLIQYKNKKKPIRPLIYIFCLVPLGLVAYSYYLKVAFGDSLLFWHAQPAFGAERIGAGIILPFQVIYRYIKILLSVNIKTLAFWNALFEISSFLFAFFILLLGHKKKIRLSYLVFSWLSLILPSLTGTFSSMPRYILTIFPIYIVLGTINNKILKFSIIIINELILVIATILFTRGYWVA